MSASPKSKIAPFFLVGATGTGKSELAHALARRHGAAILALDAMQVYRGADIGTSKPTPQDQAEVAHGGLDLTDFGTSFDVAQYLRHVEDFLRTQIEANRQVIIVGGTGLYFRALTRGLCEAPQGSDDLRGELNALSIEELLARLTRIDPAILPRLDSANPRRLIRAIEVMETTGCSLLEWQEATPKPLIPEYTALWLDRDKAELQDRLQRRVEAMFAAGWIDEVRALVERHGLEKVLGFTGIGYREIARMLAGGSASLPAVKSDILVATRQYAKRQLTWFSREPNLQRVMLSSTQPLPAALLSLS